LRVLDITRGIAGPLATMILADFGADVVRVEPPGGDPGWSEPAYLLLNRGKKSVDLDLRSTTDQEQLRRLATVVDVVIETLAPGEANEAGIGYGALSASNPGLVYCSITGFGPDGPLAQVKPDDGLVMAKAGIFRDQPGWYEDGRRPVFRSPKDGSYFAAMLTVQGILAALRVRDLTGRGQLVETNLLQALTCRQNPKVRWLLREGEELPAETGQKTRAQDDQHSLPHHQDPKETNLIGMRVQCKDGRWMVHSHTEPHFFPSWIKVVGFDWIWEDDRFRGAPHKFSDDADKAELIRLLQERMLEKTAAEWMDAYLANGNVCGDIVQTTQEALRHPQVLETENVVDVDDPRVGRIVQVGPLAKIPGAPAVVRGAAPIPGQDTAAILGSQVTPRRTRPVRGPAPMAGPLDGITIVECAYYYATPFGTALLSDLGARVIKIERLQSDPYRLLGAAGKDPIMNLGHNNMVRAMQGKHDIALNLKDSRGRDILHQLVERADVFIHSFRPGVPESLGIDYDTLRRVNPTLVYQYSGSYGSTGPYSRQPAIDPIIAAFAGTTAYQAGEGNPPLTETGADPISAAGHAACTLLGLLARQQTGLGQYVESAMILSNLYLNCEDALSYAGKPPRPSVDRLQLGTAATRRLYQTAPPQPGSVEEPYANPDSCWVFLSAEQDDEFTRLCEVAGRPDISNDPRFAHEEARTANRTGLETVLEPVFRTRPAREWEITLLAAGVGCVRADAMSHFAFLYKDPQAQALEMMVKVEHPSFGGVYWRHAPLIHFSETPGRVGPHCEMGEHTRMILDELGYDEEQMNSLKDDNVVSWPIAADSAMART
jgi:crotonobetainyl-CoA:carnitine CoA-transferase CaiB-like acyl-CoA transferase